MRKKMIRFGKWVAIVTISGAAGLILMMIGVASHGSGACNCEVQASGFEYGMLGFMLFGMLVFILFAIWVLCSLAAMFFILPAKKTISK